MLEGCDVGFGLPLGPRQRAGSTGGRAQLGAPAFAARAAPPQLIPNVRGLAPAGCNRRHPICIDGLLAA
jgi:hypothetical protein